MQLRLCASLKGGDGGREGGIRRREKTTISAITHIQQPGLFLYRV